MQIAKATGEKTSLKANFKYYYPLWLMMLPGLLYLIINNYIPMVGIVIAFKKIDFSLGIFKSPWAGIDNFRFLFASPDAFTITRNTILYNLVFILLDNVLGVLLAVVLNEIRQKRMKTFYQGAVLLPYLISMVLVTYIVFAFLSAKTGIINAMIKQFGGKAINWYIKADYWPVILTVVHVWKSIGFNVIIYTSALVGIGTEYYEAASIDGASRWKQFTSITVPLLRPMMIMLMVLSVGRMFYSDFGLFYQVTMNSGILYRTTSTIDTYVYNALMQTGDISMSSAAGFFQSIVGFICIMTMNLIVRKFDRQQALF